MWDKENCLKKFTEVKFSLLAVLSGIQGGSTQQQQTEEVACIHVKKDRRNLQNMEENSYVNMVLEWKIAAEKPESPFAN